MLRAGIATRILAFPTGEPRQNLAAAHYFKANLLARQRSPLLTSAALLCSRCGLSTRGWRGLCRLLPRAQAFAMLRLGGSFSCRDTGLTLLSGRSGVRFLAAFRTFLLF